MLSWPSTTPLVPGQAHLAVPDCVAAPPAMKRFYSLSVKISGVFVDTDEIPSVSVMEGDSVTLYTDVTELQEDDEIEWRFNGILIATVSRDPNGISVWVNTDGALKDRLQLENQTGDLKIRNIRNTDSGQWKINILSTRGSTSKTFYISVVPVGEVKSVSVLEGDSVTLNSNINEIQRYDVIRWRFEHQNHPVAEINRKAGIFNTYDGADRRFRDRLQLDCFTGSLTIRNIGTRHSGLYEVDISSTDIKHTIHKSFNVTVSDAVKSLSVKEREYVTLQAVTEIQSNDHILWLFGDTVLAEIHKADQRFSTSDGPDERFRGRLKLNNQTGSLIITNTRTTDSGLYELKISSSRYTINRRFIVTVTGLSPAAVAGIVVGVILVAAAVAALVINHRRKISELEGQSSKYHT
ncbi:uncharacterized protein LOC107729909 [Sinocyclocheilus rhinocerous]|uniref:uncharacterized protein LOC107729909 n=1 Tax=Sinocyclocheilus rhinocerous TaxID=307959 RepID=UPI0007B9CDB0|nr:PREDICTED: uncharacterized protein LOC107729909 [Sinocyclocheilus rhinocerous]